MSSREYQAWLAYYSVEPWGLVDRFIAGRGEAPPPDFESMKRELSGALGVGADG